MDQICTYIELLGRCVIDNFRPAWLSTIAWILHISIRAVHFERNWASDLRQIYNKISIKCRSLPSDSSAELIGTSWRSEVTLGRGIQVLRIQSNFDIDIGLKKFYCFVFILIRNSNSTTQREIRGPWLIHATWGIYRGEQNNSGETSLAVPEP